MNTQNSLLTTAMPKPETKKMYPVLSEPISHVSNQGNSFTAADLWNIQKKGKAIQIRNWSA